MFLRFLSALFSPFTALFSGRSTATATAVPSTVGHPVAALSLTVPVWFAWDLYLDKIRNPQRHLPPGTVQSVEILYDSLPDRPSRLSPSVLRQLSGGIPATDSSSSFSLSSAELSRLVSIAGTPEFVHRVMRVRINGRDAVMNELISVEQLRNSAGEVKEQLVHFRWLDHPTEEGEIFNRLRSENGFAVAEWGAIKFARGSVGDSASLGPAPPNSSPFFGQVVKHFTEDAKNKFEQWSKLKQQTEAEQRIVNS